MNLYEILTDLGSKHLKFKDGGYTDLISFDLKNNTIKNGKTVLMEKGKIIPQTITLSDGSTYLLTEDMERISFKGNVYEEAEKLFQKYKTSVPEVYADFAKYHFLAKKMNDIPLRDFMTGERRQLARIKLEAFVMLNEFPWENERHYYWQSKSDKEFIILKEWKGAA